MASAPYYKWHYKKLRKGENRYGRGPRGKFKDLPATRVSKDFASEKEAIEYAKARKKDWLQGTLYFTDPEKRIFQRDIGGVGIYGGLNINGKVIDPGDTATQKRDRG